MINYNLKTSGVLTGLAIVIIVSCSCFQTGMKKHNDTRKTMLLFQFPIVTLDGELRNISDSLIIYDHGDKIIYGLPYTYTLENDTSIILQESRYNYLAYKRGAHYGYYFDSAKAINSFKVPVDSTLKARRFNIVKLYNGYNDSLIEQIKSNDQFALIQKYITKTKPDQSYPDTCIFYYTNGLKDFEYSLSPELEQLHKLKVCKVRLIYNSQFYKDYSFKFPSREFRFELKEIKDLIEKDIVTIFDSIR